MNKEIKRKNIYYADLDPVIGSEQGGKRPVLIIQNNIGNRFSPTVLIAPFTKETNSKAILPTHVKIKAFGKIKYDSIILLEQIRAIDKSRLLSFSGKLNFIQMYRVNKALLISIGISKNNI